MKNRTENKMLNQMKFNTQIKIQHIQRHKLVPIIHSNLIR
jgi:hypothetical protein